MRRLSRSHGPSSSKMGWSSACGPWPTSPPAGTDQRAARSARQHGAGRASQHQGEVFRYLVDTQEGDEVDLYVGEAVYRYFVEQKLILKEKGEPPECGGKMPSGLLPPTMSRDAGYLLAVHQQYASRHRGRQAEAVTRGAWSVKRTLCFAPRSTLHAPRSTIIYRPSPNIPRCEWSPRVNL